MTLYIWKQHTPRAGDVAEPTAYELQDCLAFDFSTPSELRQTAASYVVVASHLDGPAADFYHGIALTLKREAISRFPSIATMEDFTEMEPELQRLDQIAAYCSTWLLNLSQAFAYLRKVETDIKRLAKLADERRDQLQKEQEHAKQNSPR